MAEPEEWDLVKAGQCCSVRLGKPRKEVTVLVFSAVTPLPQPASDSGPSPHKPRQSHV